MPQGALDYPSIQRISLALLNLIQILLVDLTH
jgi:hypothetical protein